MLAFFYAELLVYIATLSVIMLNVGFFCYAECRYTECRYAESPGARITNESTQFFFQNVYLSIEE